MKSPYRNLNRTGFVRLTGEAQRQRTKFEYIVIILMLLLTVTSILWSITIHILSGDLYNGMIGAKLAFRERDFTEMNEHSKQLFYKNLGKIFNETYAKTASNEATEISNAIPKDAFYAFAQQENALDNRPTTKKPRRHKIAHLFQTSFNTNELAEAGDESQTQTEVINLSTTTMAPKIKLNATADKIFLATMTIDIHQTRWSYNASVDYIYNFPFFSEVISIVWAAMCLVFQSGVKKYWSLPKPWRIVVPSIVMFSVMSTCTLIYVVLAHTFLKAFCHDLRAPLTKPTAISCGEAISVLRPIIRDHEFSHDFYLNLFRVSQIFTLILWLLALLIMVLRYALAIDFQLVEVHGPFTKPNNSHRAKQSKEYTEVLLTPSQYQPKVLQVGGHYSKSDDDFQSAKSQISEVATPFLEPIQHHKLI